MAEAAGPLSSARCEEAADPLSIIPDISKEGAPGFLANDFLLLQACLGAHDVEVVRPGRRAVWR